MIFVGGLILGLLLGPAMGLIYFVLNRIQGSYEDWTVEFRPGRYPPFSRYNG